MPADCGLSGQHDIHNPPALAKAGVGGAKPPVSLGKCVTSGLWPHPVCAANTDAWAVLHIWEKFPRGSLFLPERPLNHGARPHLSTRTEARPDLAWAPQGRRGQAGLRFPAGGVRSTCKSLGCPVPAGQAGSDASGRGPPPPGPCSASTVGPWTQKEPGFRVRPEHPHLPTSSGFTFAARARKGGRKEASSRVHQPLRLALFGALHARGLLSMGWGPGAPHHFGTPGGRLISCWVGGSLQLGGRGQEQAGGPPSCADVTPPTQPTGEGRAQPRLSATQQHLLRVDAGRPVLSGASHGWPLSSPSKTTGRPGVCPGHPPVTTRKYGFGDLAEVGAGRPSLTEPWPHWPNQWALETRANREGGQGAAGQGVGG